MDSGSSSGLVVLYELEGFTNGSIVLLWCSVGVPG